MIGERRKEERLPWWFWISDFFVHPPAIITKFFIYYVLRIPRIPKEYKVKIN
jgi:hypothetical protein